jgi:hypothetical protein
VSGEREAGDTRSRALQSGKPNTHCWRDPCYSLIQDMQLQTEGTRNQFNQAVQNCAFLCKTFDLLALNFNTLYESCHSANSAYSDLRKYGFVTYRASITQSQNKTAPRLNAHQCLIGSKPFPRYPPYYIHSTRPTKSSVFELRVSVHRGLLNKIPTRCSKSSLFSSFFALHVSGATFTHHQEPQLYKRVWCNCINLQ